MNKIAKSTIAAVVAALTASVTCVLAESEAGLQASSSSSTMNTAQASRQTGTASSSQNSSLSQNQQHSQATSANSSMGQSEAIGGAVNSLHPGVYRASANSPSKMSRVTTRPRSVRTARSKRSFSSSYMVNTIRQAARTK